MLAARLADKYADPRAALRQTGGSSTGTGHRAAVLSLNWVQFIEALRLLAEEAVGHPASTDMVSGGRDGVQAGSWFWLLTHALLLITLALFLQCSTPEAPVHAKMIMRTYRRCTSPT